MSDSKEVLVDSELKEMIVHALESTGMLQNIRAQLRAATYLALEGQEDFPEKFSRIRAISETENGVLAIQLVRDFLLHCNLPNTLRVFDTESGQKESSQQGDSASVGLSLNFQQTSEKPFLVQLLETYQNSKGELQRPKTASRRTRSPLSSPRADEPAAGDTGLDQVFN